MKIGHYQHPSMVDSILRYRTLSAEPLRQGNFRSLMRTTFEGLKNVEIVGVNTTEASADEVNAGDLETARLYCERVAKAASQFRG